MSNIEFEKNNYESKRNNNNNKGLSFINWLIDKKIANNEKQARYIVVSIALICFIGSIYFIFFK